MKLHWVMLSLFLIAAVPLSSSMKKVRRATIFGGLGAIAAGTSGGLFFLATKTKKTIQMQELTLQTLSKFYNMIEKDKSRLETVFQDQNKTNQEKAVLIKALARDYLVDIQDFKNIMNAITTMTSFSALYELDAETQTVLTFLRDINNKNDQEIVEQATAHDGIILYFNIIHRLIDFFRRDLSYYQKLLRFLVLPGSMLSALIMGFFSYKAWNAIPSF